MIALVTGASGFIGSHLVDRLRVGGTEVRVVTRPLPAPPAFEQSPLWEGVTHVFHLAARTRAPDAAAFHAANVQYTAQLLAGARAQRQMPHVVFVSSLAAGGGAAGPTRPRTEADADAPVGVYGRSKHAAEQLVRQCEGMRWTIVRPPAVYGPRDRDFLALFRQLRWPLHLRVTPGWHALTLAHVDDVVSALLTVAQHPAAVGRVYGLGGDDCRWDALYEAVQQALWATAPGTPAGVRRRSRPVQVPDMLVTGAAHVGGLLGRVTGRVPLASPDKVLLGRTPWWLSSGEQLARDTGWRPIVGLDDGLRATAAWYRTQGWL